MSLKLAALYTLSAANEGRELKLKLPDGSFFAMNVLGYDSDAFKQAVRSDNRSKKDKKEGDEETPDEKREKNLQLHSVLVTSWNAEEECTPENVMALFENAPWVFAELLVHLGDRNVWLGKPEAN